jgi:hypothetical protein
MASEQDGTNGLSSAQLRELEEIIRGCERALDILGDPDFPTNRRIRGLQTVFTVAKSAARDLLTNGVKEKDLT